MKCRLWVNNLLAIALSLPLSSQQASQGLIAGSIYQLAQGGSSYRELMDQVYDLVKKRKYKDASILLEQARPLSRGSGSFKRAKDNVDGYIKRGTRNKIGIAGNPGKVASAATRGDCFENQKAAIALVPPGREAVLTMEEYPTFYFYIPQITPKVQVMEFVLRDDENIRPLYRESFRPVKQSGIVKVRIPSNSQPLQLDKQYTWGFSLVCDRYQRDEDLYSEGKIKRLEDEDLTAQLQKTHKILDRAILYTIAGFWQDAFSSVASLRYEHPNDPEVKKYWADLLESLQELGVVGVLDAVDQPFLPCCSSE